MNKEKNVENFLAAAKKLGIQLSDRQMAQLLQYYELLIEKNKVMNLTAITEFEDVLIKHFLDSLSLIHAMPEVSRETLFVLDLGTGAGFPGIPLKIAFPQLNFVLADSLNKRIKFLNEVIEALDLDGISAIHGRAEELARKPEYREQFDLCVSRAVANLSSLSEYCLPFVRVGGLFVSYKSGNVDDEVKNSERALRLLGGKQKNIYRFTLPDSDIERSLIVIEKEKPMSSKYPRKAGTPGKEPL